MAKGTARRRMSRSRSAAPPQAAGRASTGSARTGAAPLLPRAVIALVFLALAPGLAAAASASLPWRDFALLAVTMLLIQLAALGAGSMASSPGPPASRPLAVGVGVTAGLALFLSSTQSFGTWLAAIAVLLTSLASAVSRPTAVRWTLLAVAATSTAWWASATGGQWHLALLWLLPVALAGALAFAVAGFPSPGVRTDGLRFRVALALAGLCYSLTAIVLAFESPAVAIFVAIEGAFALVLAPRAARVFGQRGLAGLVAAAATVTWLALALAL